MDRFDQLRIFIRVAQSGSFTAAAEQLDLPRPTVSLAIRQLEARLGARFLHRTTRRVSVTRDGEALLEQALALVADSEELDQQFRGDGPSLQGHLRVDMPSRIARRQVAPALPAFLDRHAQLTLEIGSSDRAVDLVLEGLDCALRVGELPSTSLVARPIGRLRLISCASPAYLERHGVPQTPDDLDRHQAVQYASPTSGRAVPWEWQADGHTQVRQMPSRVSANNAETYIACCLAGLGLIQIPAFDVHEHLQRGELVEVLAAHLPAAMPVHIVYPHRRHLPRRVQVFSDWLAELLGPCLETPTGAA